jgi:serine/threonine protein kinase
MPALSTTAELLGLFQKSELFDRARYERHFPGGAGLSPDPRECAAALVKAGLLTAYQAKQLLLGKHRGFVLGSYKILQPVGKGGAGTVFLAEHTAMKRRVALKVVQFDRGQDKLSLERFHREARSAAALDHPNIVRLFDIGQHGKIHFMAMEYVDGRTLDGLVDEANPVPFSQAVAYVSQAAAGLQHAHDKGLVHRDIKPGNLILAKDGTVKVLDMGLARSFHSEADNLTGALSTDTEAVGTADYVSPEQALNKEVDTRGDIYSLGCTLYALIAGFPPFRGTMMQKLAQHQTVEPTPLSSLRPEVPEALDLVVSKMMAKKPSKRYASADEVIEALAPWMPGPKSRTVAAVATAPVAPVAGSELLRDFDDDDERDEEIDVPLIAKAHEEREAGVWAMAGLIGGSVVFVLLCLAGVGWLFLRPVQVETQSPPESRVKEPAPAQAPPPVVALPPVERPVPAYFEFYPLERYATSTTRRPLFLNRPDETYVFPDHAVTWMTHFPFKIARPLSDSDKNVLQLNSTEGTQSREAPESVTLPINAKVAKFHFLGGVGGWAWPWKPPGSQEDLKGKVAMRLRVRYADKAVEEHEWLNGVHVADWVRVINVERSSLAMVAPGNRQVRYLSLTPNRRDEQIESLELEKGEIPELSNVVFALTIEKPH